MKINKGNITDKKPKKKITTVNFHTKQERVFLLGRLARSGYFGYITTNPTAKCDPSSF